MTSLEGDWHPESLTAAEDLWSRVRVYVVREYVPTLMHALFHLMGVLLAFILASAWFAGDRDIRDGNTKLGILNVLEKEVNFNYGVADQAKSSQRSCPGVFFRNGREGEMAFRTDRWDAFNNTGQAVALGTDLYTAVDASYRNLVSEPEKSKHYASAACAQELSALQAGFRKLADDLDAAKHETQGQLNELRWRLWPQRFDRMIVGTFALWLTIIVMPVVIYAGKIMWWRERDLVVARLASPRVVKGYAWTAAFLLFAASAAGFFGNLPAPLRDLRPTALTHALGGMLALYAGYFNTRGRTLTQLLGVLLTFVAIAGLAFPVSVYGRTGPAEAPVILFQFGIGAVGLWMGFAMRRAAGGSSGFEHSGHGEHPDHGRRSHQESHSVKAAPM